MKNKVVHLGNLGSVRELLAEWEQVRKAILAGDVDGWYAMIRDAKQRESIYLGGVFKTEKISATKAALRISAARALIEDDPPPLQTGS